MNASELILAKKNIFRSDDNKFIKINRLDVIHITLSHNTNFICLFDKTAGPYIFNHCELETEEHGFYSDDSPLCLIGAIERLRLATKDECLLLLYHCTDSFDIDGIQTFIKKVYGESND